MAEPNRENNNPYPNLDFVKIFDGAQPEIGDAERLLAAEKFEYLVDEQFLRYADFTRPSPGFSERSSLSLEVPAETGHWAISLETDIEKNSEDEPLMKAFGEIFPFLDAPRAIVVQRVDGSARRREGFAYYEDPEGVVRRHDMGDAWVQGNEVSEKDTSQDIVEKIGNALFKGIALKAEYQAFEREMGLNHQPVASDEIEGLRAMIASPCTRLVSQ